MRQTRALSDLFQVSERFHRSVNIAADYRCSWAFDEYIITSLSRGVVLRISQGLKESGEGRAWSITGPYGAGKSAFALFMAQILGFPPSDDARESLRTRDPQLLEDLLSTVPGLREGGFVVVPVVGGREPISWSLLDGLITSLSAQAEQLEGLEGYIDSLLDLRQRARQGDLIPAGRIMEVVEDLAHTVRSSVPSALGILIIYDELGRALEHAALYPDQGDVGVLQTLAELAARSARTPIGLVTILHQAFEHYAANLSALQRREWAKVQGRFEDIGFLASPGELLGMIDRAINLVASASELEAMVVSETQQAETLGLLPTDLVTDSGRQVLAGCAPLHPTVALVLGPLFRSRLSQNERSLFAFLTSGEPHGFQEYLREEAWSDNAYLPFYRLDRLYDYVSTALGNVLYTQPQGKRWAEIEDALHRLPEDSLEVEARVVKTVGLLGLLGDQRDLKASAEVLGYALANGHDVDGTDVQGALARLQHLGIIVHRRFKDAYSLWEGSDIDLDECYERGLSHIDRAESVAALLQSYGDIKPYVAKRHLHDSGTFRYFVSWTIDFEELDTVSSRSLAGADGAVVFIVGTGGVPTDKVVSEVKLFSAQLRSPAREVLLFAVPDGVQGIREALEETMAWEWVAHNTPELEGDSVARRELAARRLAAHDRLRRTTERCFEPVLGYRTCTWVRAGDELVFRSARDLRAVFSDASDEAYWAAPIVKNELVNRSKLSSAAAAARRNLVERMITRPTQPMLGMDGYPPEMSMYLSVLQESGIHHAEGPTWVFGPPLEEDPCGVTQVWKAMDAFLGTTIAEPRAVTEVYKLLKEPPFGMREGILPIYLVAALIHWQAEVAVYEEGVFIPQLDTPACERLMRVPQRFSVQRFPFDDARALMLKQYSELLTGAVDPRSVTILTGVRPIVSFANQLPGYTRLTGSLSHEAKAVRDALLSAREPQRLLLETLPRALGFTPSEEDTDKVEDFFSRLKTTLAELHGAYDQLITRIHRELCDALLLPHSLSAARKEIGLRAEIMSEWIADLRLRAFVTRLRDRTLADREWLESVAAVLASKPPNRWNDSDVVAYRMGLAEIAGQFRRAEEIAVSDGQSRGDPPEARTLRLAVTDVSGRENRELVRIRAEAEAEVTQLVDVLLKKLQDSEADPDLRMMAIAELARQVLRDRTGSEERND
jgi:hypothetical protein